MEELITLCTALDSLSNSEFIKFINSYDKIFIANILFHFFHYQLKEIKNLNETELIISNIKNMKESISKIIRSRNTKNNVNLSQMELDDEENEPIKFDELPNVMISEISSYLDFESTLNLEKSNRKMFIGTRSPISIYNLNEKYFAKCWSFCNKHYQLYHWIRFKSLTTLTISIDKLFHETEEEWIFTDTRYKLKDVLMSHQLQKLNIINSDIDFDIDYADECNINKFIHNLSQCGLSNVETIEFDHGTIELNDDIKHRLGITLPKPSNTDTSNDTVIIGNGKESLHLDEDAKLQLDEKYDNLKEICLKTPSKVEIDALNHQNLRYLQRIHCDLSGFNTDCSALIGLLFMRESVNYISVNASVIKEEFIPAINVLNESLKNMCRRKQMKIRISASNHYMGMDVDISNDLLMILKHLDEKTDDFMLIGDVTITPQHQNTITELLHQYEHQYSIRRKREMKLGVYFHKFVVSNKNCVIDGYQEKWKTNCYNCEQDTLFE